MILISFYLALRFTDKEHKNCTYSGRGKLIHTLSQPALSREILCLQQETARVGGFQAATHNSTPAFNHVSRCASTVSHRVVLLVFFIDPGSELCFDPHLSSAESSKATDG